MRVSAAIAGSVVLFAHALPAQRTETGHFRWDGLDRTFTVHVPRSADSVRPIPLVIVLHGRGGTGQRVIARSGFEAKADAEGFLLVGPDGTGEPRGWYTGFASGAGIDDVGFIGALIDTLRTTYPVDRRRIYVAGYSNGGFLTHRVASDLSLRIAAAAVFAGAVGARLPNGTVARIDPPRAPVAMLILHGDADDVIPYDTLVQGTGRVARPLAAPEGARFWARANECATLEPRRDTLARGRVLRDTWGTRCRAPVVFLTLRGGDHGWPRTADGAPINATDAMWEFFAQHTR